MRWQCLWGHLLSPVGCLMGLLLAISHTHKDSHWEKNCRLHSLSLDA